MDAAECTYPLEKVSMPSRAYTSLLHGVTYYNYNQEKLCQCPHGLIPHCYVTWRRYSTNDDDEVSMPSRAYTSLLLPMVDPAATHDDIRVNALTGLYLIATRCIMSFHSRSVMTVSMPSRAYTSLLQYSGSASQMATQSVSMPSRAYTSLLPRRRSIMTRQRIYSVNALTGLYLIATLRRTTMNLSTQHSCVNALTGLYLIATLDELESKALQFMMCQCPHGLIPHCYSTPSKT